MLGLFSTFFFVFAFIHSYLICLIVFMDIMLHRASKAFIHEYFLLGSFLLALSLYLSLSLSLCMNLCMILLTCCQDHILTENIWFVRSKTSYSGEKSRCYRCGTNKRTREYIELLSQWMLDG